MRILIDISLADRVHAHHMLVMVSKVLLRENRLPHDLALLGFIFLVKPHAIASSLIEELAIRAPDLLLKLVLEGVNLLLEGVHEEWRRLLLQSHTSLHLL